MPVPCRPWPSHPPRGQRSFGSSRGLSTCAASALEPSCRIGGGVDAVQVSSASTNAREAVRPGPGHRPTRPDPARSPLPPCGRRLWPGAGAPAGHSSRCIFEGSEQFSGFSESALAKPQVRKMGSSLHPVVQGLGRHQARGPQSSPPRPPTRPEARHQRPVDDLTVSVQSRTVTVSSDEARHHGRPLLRPPQLSASIARREHGAEAFGSHSEVGHVSRGDCGHCSRPVGQTRPPNGPGPPRRTPTLIAPGSPGADRRTRPPETTLAPPPPAGRPRRAGHNPARRGPDTPPRRNGRLARARADPGRSSRGRPLDFPTCSRAGQRDRLPPRDAPRLSPASRSWRKANSQWLLAPSKSSSAMHDPPAAA